MREEFLNGSTEQSGDRVLRLLDGQVDAVNPQADGLAGDSEATSEPGLRAAFVDEDSLERSLGPVDHVANGSNAIGTMSSGHAADGPLSRRNHPACMPCMAATAAFEPYWERFARLKEEKGLSWSQLVRASKRASLSTLRSLAIEPSTDADGARGRERYPSAETLEDAATALGVSPYVFPEYQLAKAREQFDERTVGLEEALSRLEGTVYVRQPRGFTVTINEPIHDVDVAIILDESHHINQNELVETLRALLDRIGPDVDVEAAVAEATMPTKEAAETRRRGRLRAAAQRKRERPEDPPGTQNDADDQATGT